MTCRTVNREHSAGAADCYCLESLQVAFSFFQVRKQFLFFLKCCRMDASAAAAQLDWMTQVQHLVVEEILDGAAGRFRAIEDPADHDGVVGRVIVAQTAAGVVAAPGELRSGHEAVEKSGVQVIKNLLQIVVQAFRPVEPLAPAHLPDQVSLGGDALAAAELAEACGMLRINFFAVELGKQNVKDGMENGLRRTLKQV